MPIDLRLIKTILLILLIVIPINKAFAGPPFNTDDADPTDYKHWEIYLASSYDKNSINGKTYSLPQLEFDYGLIPNGQISVVIQNVLNKPSDNTLDSHYGLGDTNLGFKYRFIQETNYIPEIAFFPSALLSTGNNNAGLGNGKTQTFIPLWLEKNFGSWRIYGGSGYWFNTGIGNKDWVYSGLTLEKDLNEKLTVGGEFFHRTADKYDDKGSSGFNLGLTYNINERYHLLFSAGRDVQGPNHLTGYAAVKITF